MLFRSIQYEKVTQEKRIDVFDAAVFACVQMLETVAETAAKNDTASKWLRGGAKG